MLLGGVREGCSAGEKADAVVRMAVAMRFRVMVVLYERVIVSMDVGGVMARETCGGKVE